MNEQEYERSFQGVWRETAGTGYSFLLRNVLFAVKSWADRVNFKGKVAYFFESGHRDAGQSHIIMNRILSQPSRKDDYRYLSHSYVDKRDFLPLQAADLLAWLSRDAIIKSRVLRERRSPISVGGGTTGGAGRWGCGASGASGASGAAARSTSRTAS
jgi:hypothetical protein